MLRCCSFQRGQLTKWESVYYNKVSTYFAIQKCSKTAQWRFTQQSKTISTASFFHVDPCIKEAVACGQPVVALESTIYTHGLPYPQNRQLAQELNGIVKKAGAIPATVGVIDGVLTVGLNSSEIDYITDPAVKALKVSRRDLSTIIARKHSGGTTVAATMIACKMAGIKVFATGGIGGVHRDGENTLDISADLIELGKTPVAVVCSGAKSILDIGRTLEFLETQGVPVISFGQEEFPAFYTPDSGFKSPMTVYSAQEAAKTILTQECLALDNGIVFGIPIPREHRQEGAKIQNAIKVALSELEKTNIKGNDVTPWLLERVKVLSEGSSLQANLALIKNNALVASEISCAFSNLQKFNSTKQSHHVSKETDVIRASLLCFGSTSVDITGKIQDEYKYSTTPSSVHIGLGGVARNITEAAHKLGVSPAIIVSPVPDPPDELASIMYSKMKLCGLSTNGLVKYERTSDTTPSFPVATLTLDQNRNMVSGAVDMSAVALIITPDVIRQKIGQFQPRFIAFDGNLDVGAIRTIIEETCVPRIPILFEPTSDAHSEKLSLAIQEILNSVNPDVNILQQPLVTHVTPNRKELEIIARTLQKIESSSYKKAYQHFKIISNDNPKEVQWLKDIFTEMSVSNPVSQFLKDVSALLPVVKIMWIKQGAHGLFTITRLDQSDITDKDENFKVFKNRNGDPVAKIGFHPAIHVREEDIVSGVGAGDTLAGAIIDKLLSEPAKETDQSDLLNVHSVLNRIAHFSQRAAAITIQNQSSVGQIEKLAE